MLTGIHIRMARAALKWSADELAGKVGVAASTIRRLENSTGTPNALTQTIENIEIAFADEGVTFVHGEEIGVLIKAPDG